MAGSEPKRPGDVFDLDRLRDLIELMQQYDLSEVDLKQEKQHIRLSRGAELVMGPALPPAPGHSPPAVTPHPVEEVGSADTASSADIVTIDSPMVGTFYAKPNPDAEVFVKVGDHVGPESVVCIIEAMKVFNEIPAEVSGKVVAVMAKNEESVDFGKPLFKIDTSS